MSAKSIDLKIPFAQDDRDTGKHLYYYQKK